MLLTIKLDKLLYQLDVLTNPKGTYADELDKRMKTSAKLSQCINKSFILPQNALQIYNQIWLPSMKFPLSVTTYTEKDNMCLMRPFLNTINCKLGFNKYMSQ
eukprot:1362059-Ditylum_brightwellii.AAC.1